MDALFGEDGKKWDDIKQKYPEKELVEINKYFSDVLKSCFRCKNKSSVEQIKRAYCMALHAHREQRRKTGEPFIYHPLEVAKIVGSEMGLGTTSVVSALLHDVIEDNDKEYSEETIKEAFSEKIAFIVKGLTKITKLDKPKTSQQSENFLKMLLTIPEDIRVIFIKIADRLHNMRTLDGMREGKQLEKSAETLYIYAPLAHRLGFYNIRKELENLGFRFREPEKFLELSERARKTEIARSIPFEICIEQISTALNRTNLEYRLDDRKKSLYTTYMMMKRENIPFEEIHSFSALRIVFKADSKETERQQCYSIFAIVTGLFTPKLNSLRDSVGQPRSNGFEALIVDVMGPDGQWFEIQIMSERMDEIADRGIASDTLKQTDTMQQKMFEGWVDSIKEQVRDTENETLDILDDFQLNLFSSEIYVFTPKGELKRFPKGSTVLDFAFSVHTDLGLHTVQAKVNHQIVDFDYVLNSTDKVEIITNPAHNPEWHWINSVKTARAKAELRKFFKAEKKKYVHQGEKILENTCKSYKVQINDEFIRQLCNVFQSADRTDLLFKIGKQNINKKELKREVNSRSSNRIIDYWIPNFLTTRSKNESPLTKPPEIIPGKPIVVDTTIENYCFASCCSPLANDEAIGYVEDDQSITIHKRNCLEAIWLSANRGKRVFPIHWQVRKEKSFLTKLAIKGVDRMRLVSEITNLISEQLSVNMNSVTFNTKNGGFVGEIELYVSDIKHLNNIIVKIKGVKNVKSVEKIEVK